MANTLQNWVEVGIIISIFLIILTASVIIPMNSRFSQSNDIGLSGNLSEYKQLQQNMQQKIDKGKPTFLGELGMALSTSWDMIKLAVTTVFTLVSGNWIPKLVIDYLKLPAPLGYGLQFMYLLSVLFIVASIIFKRDQT